MSSYCVICFDDGTADRPLIRPCKTCSIETHRNCILNLISTHLIAERAIFPCYLKPHTELKEGLLQSPEGIEVFDRYDVSLLYATALDLGKSHYLKYFKRSGILNSNPPQFSIKDAKSVFYLRGLTRPMIYLNDRCPQCKKNISLVSPIKTWMPSFFQSKINYFTNFQTFLSGIKTNTWMLNLFLPQLPLFYAEELYSSVSTICGALPWIYLGRNITEFQSNLDAIVLSDISVLDVLCISSQVASIMHIWSLFRIFILGYKRNNSLPSYLKFLALLTKQICDVVYIFTFNWFYFHWAIEVNIIQVTNTMTFKTTPTNAEMLRNLPLGEKIMLLSLNDYKEAFVGVWDNPYFKGNMGMLTFPSLDESFKYLCLSWFGFSLGNNIIGKCKPLVKFIYKLFKSFKPLPVEVEMIFEYLGYQTVMFVKELYDFYAAYCEYSALKSFRVY